MAGMHITDEHALTIAAALPNSHLATRDLSGNTIGMPGACALIHRCPLKTLDLSGLESSVPQQSLMLFKPETLTLTLLPID